MDHHLKQRLIDHKQGLRSIAGDLCDHEFHDTPELQRCPGYGVHRAILDIHYTLLKLDSVEDAPCPS